MNKVKIGIVSRIIITIIVLLFPVFLLLEMESVTDIFLLGFDPDYLLYGIYFEYLDDIYYVYFFVMFILYIGHKLIMKNEIESRILGNSNTFSDIIIETVKEVSFILALPMFVLVLQFIYTLFADAFKTGSMGDGIGTAIAYILLVIGVVLLPTFLIICTFRFREEILSIKEFSDKNKKFFWITFGFYTTVAILLFSFDSMYTWYIIPVLSLSVVVVLFASYGLGILIRIVMNIIAYILEIMMYIIINIVTIGHRIIKH